jgi:hypothetical protein
MSQEFQRARLAACTIALALSPMVSSAEPPVEPRLAQAVRAVVRLEHVARSEQSRLVPDGTAFVVEHDDALFLVTSRDVAEKGYDLRARIPSIRNDTGATEIVELRIPWDGWVFHETGPGIEKNGAIIVKLRGVDVAVAPLPALDDRTIGTFLSCDECPEDEANQLATVDPAPPTSVLVAGFPGSIGFTLREQRPIFRSGIISLIAGERSLIVEGAFADEKSVLIDGKVELGDRGSPVIRVDQLSGRITLVGLISAANQSADFGVAEPASRIRETLERAQSHPPATNPEWSLQSQPSETP